MSDRYYCKGRWEDRCVYDSELKQHLFIDDCAKLIIEQDVKVRALEAENKRLLDLIDYSSQKHREVIK